MSMEKNKRQNHKIERKKKKIQPWMEFTLRYFDIIMLQNWLRFP